MAGKKRHFDVVELMYYGISINLNAQHMNGMTPDPDFAVHNGLFYGY